MPADDDKCFFSAWEKYGFMNEKTESNKSRNSQLVRFAPTLKLFSLKE